MGDIWPYYRTWARSACASLINAHQTLLTWTLGSTEPFNVHHDQVTITVPHLPKVLPNPIDDDHTIILLLQPTHDDHAHDILHASPARPPLGTLYVCVCPSLGTSSPKVSKYSSGISKPIALKAILVAAALALLRVRPNSRPYSMPLTVHGHPSVFR